MTPPTKRTSGQNTELYRLYNDPDTAPALDLFGLFRKNQLTEQNLRAFLTALPAQAAPEIAKIDQLIKNPSAHVEADLSSRAGQLAWTAALGFVFQNSPPNSIRQHGIWTTLTDNPSVKGALGTAARYLDMSLTNRNATMNWGTPGSWFWYARDKNHINVDLFHTLLLGFAKSPANGMRGMAHATAVMLHEVGHSQHTVRWTDAMNALIGKEEELTKKGKEQELTRDEYKQLMRAKVEIKLRHNVMNAAEDNCVNRYAVNQGSSLPHDVGQSLNVCNVLLQGTGYYLKTQEDKKGGHSDFSAVIGEFFKDQKQKDIDNAEKALSKLSHALMMAFYTSNGLFKTDDTQTWKRLGLDPETVTGKDGKTFTDLMETNLAPDGIANLQPAVRDSWLLRAFFAQNVEKYAAQRCKIIDGIWDSYAAHHAKILLDALDKDLDKKLDEAQKKKGKQKGQSGNNKSGEKNQQNGGDSQPGGDDPSPQGSSGSSGDNQNGGKGPDDEAVNVQGVGKMKAGKPTSATPGQAQEQEQQGENSDKPGSGEPAQRVRDLARDAKQDEQNSGGDEGQDPNGKRPDGQENPVPANARISSGGSSGGRGNVNLAALSSGNWQDYRKRINELEPVISRVTQDFAYIRDRQKQYRMSISNDLEDMPRGGNPLQRLNMRAHMNYAAKAMTGQRVEETDRQRWRKDKIDVEQTSVELWVLGDGSGSMDNPLAGGGRRIDSCVQTMAILFESGKRAGFDCMAGMWGADKLEVIAKTGDTEKTVGDNFRRVQNGLSSGTDLTPSLMQAIDHLVKWTTDANGRTKRFAGMTHFLIISDGELNGSDLKPAVEKLTALFRHGPAVSVDIAILDANPSTYMDKMVKAVKEKIPGALIDVIHTDDAAKVPLELAKKVRGRFEKSGHTVKAVPDSQKREAFSNVYKHMKR